MSEPVSPLAALSEEIAAAEAAIRRGPTAPAPRRALFQLACAVGAWERARTQLDTLVNLDPEYTLFAHVYGRLLDAEAIRRRVFAGAERPVALGQPPAWLAMMAEALRLDARGEAAQARALRQRAIEEAPARPGRIGEDGFAWAMDADPRLGPTLEVVVEGQYRWLPLERLRELRTEPPRAMRDLVWQPATLRLAGDGGNGGAELGVFLPVRYPGSELEQDDAIRLAKATRWIEREGGEQWGLGQRLLATDLGDHAFLDIRRLLMAEEEEATPDPDA